MICARDGEWVETTSTREDVTTGRGTKVVKKVQDTFTTERTFQKEVEWLICSKKESKITYRSVEQT